MNLTRIYDRIAPMYDLLDFPFEKSLYHTIRKELLGSVRNSQVLEIGVGTGKNLPYYHPSNQVMGCDISEKMLKNATKRNLNSKTSRELVVADGRSLPVMANSISIVVCSFVIYLLDNPTPLLNEINRVLQPHGELRIIEYQTPNEPIGRVLSTLMTPITKQLFGLDMTSMNSIDIISEHMVLKSIQQYQPGWLYSAIFGTT